MQRSAIATLVERKTRHTMLVPIRDGQSAQNVGDALIEVFTNLPPALRRTLTWDRATRCSSTSASSTPARHQREHQRSAAAVLPDLYGLRRCGLGVVRSVPLDVGRG
jgi:protein required for attachment to host cells